MNAKTELRPESHPILFAALFGVLCGTVAIIATPINIEMQQRVILGFTSFVSGTSLSAPWFAAFAFRSDAARRSGVGKYDYFPIPVFTTGIPVMIIFIASIVRFGDVQETTSFFEWIEFCIFVGSILFSLLAVFGLWAIGMDHEAYIRSMEMENEHRARRAARETWPDREPDPDGHKPKPAPEPEPVKPETVTRVQTELLTPDQVTPEILAEVEQSINGFRRILHERKRTAETAQRAQRLALAHREQGLRLDIPVFDLHESVIVDADERGVLLCLSYRDPRFEPPAHVDDTGPGVPVFVVQVVDATAKADGNRETFTLRVNPYELESLTVHAAVASTFGLTVAGYDLQFES